MKTKKDQGNVLFKKQKYKQAIECYKGYVSVENDDNCKAYSNMALSYFKIKEYQNCVQACERAVQLQPQFEKPYYRMFESYRELKDYYGMMISGSRFCRLSKQEKEIKGLLAQLAKVRQQLCYNYCVGSQYKQLSQEEKFIDEIVVSYSSKQTDAVVSIKQPLMSRESKWERIVMKINQNRREGLNEGRRFINTDCQGEEQKSKYKKLLAHLKTLPVVQNTDVGASQLVVNHDVNNASSESSLQEPKVEELQQYALQKEKQQQQQKQQQKQQQQQQQQQQRSTSQPSTLSAADIQPVQQPQQNKQNQQEQQSDNEVRWQQFVTEQQAQRLFNQHISTQLASQLQDPFTALHSALMQVLRSLELDRFQKQALLSLTPLRVRKFSMLMKSYSGKQKQTLHQLFISNNLGKLWQQLYVGKK